MNSTLELNNFTSIGTTTSVVIERTTVRTRLTYPALVEAFEHELGHWETTTEERLVARKAPWSEVKEEVARMAGPRGLMVMTRLDQGEITSLDGTLKRCSLYLVGNPVIANQILNIDPRGSLYVPFRVCLFDTSEAGGASLFYDRPSSFLAALGYAELTEIGTQLDDKIDSVARALAADTGNQGQIK